MNSTVSIVPDTSEDLSGGEACQFNEVTFLSSTLLSLLLPLVLCFFLPPLACSSAANSPCLQAPNEPTVPAFGFCVSKGRRTDNEDRVSVTPCLLGRPGQNFYGVYDGHCGPRAAGLPPLMLTVPPPRLARKPFVVGEADVKRGAADVADCQR
eukprot:439780-Rhodomonas_salina.2